MGWDFCTFAGDKNGEGDIVFNEEWDGVIAYGGITTLECYGDCFIGQCGFVFESSYDFCKRKDCVFAVLQFLYMLLELFERQAAVYMLWLVNAVIGEDDSFVFYIRGVDANWQ